MVFTETAGLVYVVPVMEPPPEMSDQVPPAGVAVNALVAPSQMSAVLVVFDATPKSSLIIKLELANLQPKS